MSSAIGWVGVAAIGASVAGAGAAAYSANKQADSAQNAANLQEGIYGSTVQRNAPWVQQGQNAVGQLGQFMGTSANDGSTGFYGQGAQTFNSSDLNANLAPNYAFQLGQGEQAFDRSMGANGGQGGTGNFATRLQNYVQGTAAGAYQQAYNNFNTNQTNIYNRLSGIANMGQASANTTATAGTQTGANAGQALIAAGTYGAAGVNSATNSLSNGLQTASMWNYLNPNSQQTTNVPVDSNGTNTFAGAYTQPIPPSYSPD